MEMTRCSFNLKELSKTLDLSPTGLKQYEKEVLGINDWGSGRRGEESSYSETDYKIFRRAKSLQALGLSRKDIRVICDTEGKIIDYIDKYFKYDENSDSSYDKISVDKISLINQKARPYITSGKRYKRFVYDRNKYSKDKEHSIELDRMFKEYLELITRVLNKAKTNFDILEEDLEELQETVDSFKKA